jgi:hypothetical protein
MGHVVYSGASVVWNVDALFFILGWVWCRFDEMRARTPYAKLVLLHSMRSVGRIVHSCASRAQNVNALFLMLGWDQYGFDTKCTRTRDAKHVFLHPVGSVGHT